MTPSHPMRYHNVIYVLVVGLVLGLVALGVYYLTRSDGNADNRDKQGGNSKDAVATPRVKLAVLVVFDQMRGDFVDKWRPLFGNDGFQRLQTDGAWFSNCHYPYATTSTGPGHASMLTGACPDKHGIVNNDWYENGARVYCAGSDRFDFVPRQPKNPRGTRPIVGSPEHLLAETVADVLRDAHRGTKIFGLSLKDRSAILPVGKMPNGAFWFTGGQFVTSNYYHEGIPYWVDTLNKSRFADQWFNQPWTRSRDDVDYVKWSGPDDVEGELADKKSGQGRVFPHAMNGGQLKIGPQYYSNLANSPYGNDLLFELTKRCITVEELGADDVPDLLVVSFSSNDLIGHAWGPDSQEVLDVTLRSDAMMAKLLALLDEKVGRDKYLVAVTADHGICPLVEVSTSKGVKAKRVSPTGIRNELEKHLAAALGTPGTGDGKTEGKKSGWIETMVGPWIYFNRKMSAVMKKPVPEVARVAAEFLAKHPDIGRAFTRAELVKGFPATDVVGNRVRRSLWQPPSADVAERCGDVYVVLPEYYLPSASTTTTGTTHGAPYDYDTHVPLVVYGPGVPRGEFKEATTPQAAAAIFSRWLGLRLPKHAEFPLPEALVKE